MTRVPFVCGNWKLHKTINESLELATAIKNAVGPVRDVEVAVAPVFTALHAVVKRLEGSAVSVAGQDCFWKIRAPGPARCRASSWRMSAASTSHRPLGAAAALRRAGRRLQLEGQGSA